MARCLQKSFRGDFLPQIIKEANPSVQQINQFSNNDVGRGTDDPIRGDDDR
jgi:hypothetical protein